MARMKKETKEPVKHTTLPATIKARTIAQSLKKESGISINKLVERGMIELQRVWDSGDKTALLG